MATCAFAPCSQADECCVALTGGCVQRRFHQHVPTLVPPSELRKDAPALNGVRPRASRDPRFIKRKRKPLSPYLPY